MTGGDRDGGRLRLRKEELFRYIAYEPHVGQLEVHRSSAPRRIVACGVRWGKTVCAAHEGIAAAMAPAERSIGWVVAPTYDLADRVFREIQLVVATKLKHRIIAMKEHDRRIVLRNLGGGTSEIRAKTADNPVSLLGEGLDWLIVDEASRLKPTIWQSHLAQRLIDKRGWALLISTPRGKGYLFDLFLRGQRGADPDYASWSLPSWTNPLLDADAIEAERSRLPERVFRQEFGAQFIEGSGAVFRHVRECARGTLKEPVPGQAYFAGLDLAKVEDFTVLVIINRAREVVFVDRFHRVDWAVQVARIRASSDRYNRATVLCDSTGAGEPVYEALCRAGVRAEPYGFTARSKAALVDNLALMLEQQTICIPTAEVWPEGLDELEAFEFSVTESGNVRSGAPSGVHDDCVMALALSAWQVREGTGPPFIGAFESLADLRAGISAQSRARLRVPPARPSWVTGRRGRRFLRH